MSYTVYMSMKTPAGRLREMGARQIWKRRNEGASYKQIAEELQISVGAVCHVLKGRSWKWLHSENTAQPNS